MNRALVYCVFGLWFHPVLLEAAHNAPNCGKPLGGNNFPSDRIVGGYDVGYYRYPWFAALIRYNEVSCGGALIGPRTVITAAHCYKEFLTLASKGDLKLESIYNVKLGVYNICTTESIQTEYRVEKVQVHELYNQKKPYYDICLLTLANETRSFRPICLPQFEMSKRYKDGYVPGLGTLRYRGAMPCTVHEARLLIFNDSDCLAMINKTGNDLNSFKNAFCAGYTQGGIDTCQVLYRTDFDVRHPGCWAFIPTYPNT
ncbi:unnamed protein product [Acanthoscelides obtectus]|uniref:Peptidase S1 domain-containing protein n=1 Tax=Acanthoscelides obtectus TaxID=200917 RepID=A0A9P0KHS9_ACAOB|nr:unnamed protein product [Acanthoscelides obtectus]CAK1665343.1 hypothetical protein AOBTE_LOCUS24766 [Acanthoscelides obtectus]